MVALRGVESGSSQTIARPPFLTFSEVPNLFGGRNREFAIAFRSARVEPNHVAAIIERSPVLIEAKRCDAAAADIKKALMLDPNDADAHANRGLQHMKLKRNDEALASYERASALCHAD